MTKYNSVRGINDVLPSDCRKWRFIEARAREVFGAYGYTEIKIPVLEKAELFSRSIGEDTDIVEKEMYTFPDRKGEYLSLRPEGTASVVRAFVQHKMYAANSFVKLYYYGPMFRYERPQKGRSRQFYQIGAEALGQNNPSVDAEIISMLFTFFKALGIDDLALNINSIGCNRCRPEYKKILLAFLEDKIKRLCENCIRRYERNPLRVLDCKSSHCIKTTAHAPSIIDHLCDDCDRDFKQLKRFLDMAALEYHVNPRMVRGLDYYTKTAFEITSRKLGAQDAVAAGGRYDLLVEEIGGPPTPAIGFAIGVERLSFLVPEENIPADEPDLFIAALGSAAFESAFGLAHELRNNNIGVELDHEGKSLKSQMRRADSVRARYVLILGDNELKSGKAVLKNMKSHDQKEIVLDNVLFEMKSRKKME